MGTLADILSSRVREAIFQLLFGQKARELHLRELARQSGFSLGTVRQELQKLLRLGLVRDRRDGNRLYYRANTEHPLYPEIRNLVLKTAGLLETFKKALDREAVRVAFIFGSLANNREKGSSDVDLMVIGAVSLRDLSGWLSGVTEQIGREINPHTMSVEEFQRRKKKGDHFLSNVLESPKLFIVGSENVLAAMG